MIYDMDAHSLRTRQQRATQATIVKAYLDLAHEDGARAISMPAVAERSGVSVRTVYRYFGSKEELVVTAAKQMNVEALAGGSLYESTVADFAENLSALWGILANQLPAVCAQHATPAGRETRRERLPNARELVAGALPKGTDQQTIDLVVATTSSSMLLELVDRMGYTPEVAAEMAVRLSLLVLAEEIA